MTSHAPPAPHSTVTQRLMQMVHAVRHREFDVVRLQTITRVMAASAAVIGAVWNTASGYPYNASVSALVAVVLAGIGWLVFPSRRVIVLSVCAALTLTYLPDGASSITAGALLYLAISFDARPGARDAWCAAIIGNLAAMVVYGYDYDPSPVLASALGIGAAYAERRWLALEADTVRLKDRARLSEQQAAWLEQRTALARELHDVVGHHVTAMVVQAEAGLVASPERALETVGELGRRALHDLDAMVVHLRDPEAQIAVSALPRLSDIDELLAAPLRRQGVLVEVRIDDDAAVVLGDAESLTVYRVAQEALTNVTRHAEAQRVWVEIRVVAGQVLLRVADDGVGLHARVPEREGAGLLGVEERVRGVGGSWVLGERPGGGTMLDMYVPVVS